jgi:hypothetical protein
MHTYCATTETKMGHQTYYHCSVFAMFLKSSSAGAMKQVQQTLTTPQKPESSLDDQPANLSDDKQATEDNEKNEEAQPTTHLKTQLAKTLARK